MSRLSRREWSRCSALGNRVTRRFFQLHAMYFTVGGGIGRTGCRHEKRVLQPTRQRQDLLMAVHTRHARLVVSETHPYEYHRARRAEDVFAYLDANQWTTPAIYRPPPWLLSSKTNAGPPYFEQFTQYSTAHRDTCSKRSFS